MEVRVTLPMHKNVLLMSELTYFQKSTLFKLFEIAYFELSWKIVWLALAHFNDPLKFAL